MPRPPRNLCLQCSFRKSISIFPRSVPVCPFPFFLSFLSSISPFLTSFPPCALLPTSCFLLLPQFNIPFDFVLSHSYISSFNSISPSIINKSFTFSLLNTDEEHQKALKDLEVARRNLQVFFTVLMMFLPHCKAYCR